MSNPHHRHPDLPKIISVAHLIVYDWIRAAHSTVLLINAVIAG